MAREVHATLSQQLYTERPRAVSDVRITADYSGSDVCVQTGGVFSSHFLRDRAAVRRLSDMSDGDHHNQQQKKRTGLSFSPSSQLEYEDPSGILRLERMNSERNNKVHPNNTSKYQWEYSATGQASGEFADEINRVVQSGHTMPPLYAPDSPCSCYPLGAGFGDFSANGKMKFLCSFGGRILPRPNDGKLRYVGGETHIISIRKNISYEELSKKTYAVCKYPHTIKYQLPGEDLDSLISICSDEDLHHLIEEYHELENAEGSQRLRIFLDYCESPTSIEERAVQPIDVNYQYVEAVDGMLDPTLHSPNFRTASSHTTDLKDVHSPMPNLAEMLPRPSGQLLNPIQIPRKAFIQSPLNSPVTVLKKDFKNVDSTCAEDAINFIPFVSEKCPRDTVYYVDAIGSHNHLYHGSQLMDYHHEKFRVETDETYEVLNVHFPRGSSVDFEPAPNWGLSDTHSVKTMLKERAVNYEQLCSDAEYSMQLTSGTTHMGQRIMHSHSEPLLLEQDQKSNHGGFYPLTSFIDSDQSPSLAMSISLQDLSTMWKQRVDGVFQDAKYENHRKVASGSENETYEECNFDEKKANFNGGIYVPSLDDDQKYKYFQHVDYQQNGCLLKEVQSFGGRFSAERGLELENSADTTGGPTLIYHLETTAPKYFEESQYSTKDKQTTTNIIIKAADLKELQELGSGTFGTVFHGKWRGTDVAIKRINKSCFSGSFSEQERLTRDFWREAKILSTLHHPNVLAFYGVVPDGPDGTLATVTEYMVNGSLRHVLLRKDRVLDRRKRLIIAMDAASGMEYLHLKNIIHFDLKCDNLLVNLRDPERPVCKVGYFGLSRIKRNTLASGGMSGTLSWMAPELLDSSSSKVSEKVDVFSFGITMWEILTGEEPYASMHCGAIISGIASNTLRPPIPKRCDPEWKRLMEECWSPEPAARPSFTEIMHRLRSM